MRKRGNYARAKGGKHTCNTAAARAYLIETCDLEKVIREPMIVIRASSQFGEEAWQASAKAAKTPSRDLLGAF